MGNGRKSTWQGSSRAARDPFFGSSAAAGALVKESSRQPIAAAKEESCRMAVARLSAACWVGKAPSNATPAEAPSGAKGPLSSPRARGSLALPQQVLRLRQTLLRPGSCLSEGCWEITKWSLRRALGDCSTAISSVLGGKGAVSRWPSRRA